MVGNTGEVSGAQKMLDEHYKKPRETSNQTSENIQKGDWTPLSKGDTKSAQQGNKACIWKALKATTWKDLALTIGGGIGLSLGFSVVSLPFTVLGVLMVRTGMHLDLAGYSKLGRSIQWTGVLLAASAILGALAIKTLIDRHPPKT